MGLNQTMTRVSAFAVKALTEEMKNLKVKFDRAAYRKKYDATYFKMKTRCPNCGDLKVKHMLKRHMQTRKCKRAAEQRSAVAERS
jgi:hypothetical protein